MPSPKQYAGNRILARITTFLYPFPTTSFFCYGGAPLPKMITLRYRGHVVRTMEGSNKHKIFEAVKDRDDAFSTLDLLDFGPMNRVSYSLHALSKDGVLIRSPKPIRTKLDISSYYLYVTSEHKDKADLLFEDYIIEKLREQEFHNEVEAYYEIKHSQIPLSSVELIEKYPYLDVNLIRATFVNAGLVKAIFSPSPGCLIFYSDNVPDKLLDSLISKVSEEASKIRASKISLGRRQQLLIHEAFKSLIEKKHLAIIFDDIRLEPQKPIENSYIRPDSVAYGFLCYYDEKEKTWKKVGNQRKKFALVIESKNLTAGALHVAQRTILLDKAFDKYLFLIAAPTTYRSLWDLYQYDYFVVLEGKKLEKIISLGSSLDQDESRGQASEVGAPSLPSANPQPKEVDNIGEK